MSYEKISLFFIFAFDLETCNVKDQLYCEADAAGVYHLSRLYECFNKDLTEKDLEFEQKMVMELIVKTIFQY